MAACMQMHDSKQQLQQQQVWPVATLSQHLTFMHGCAVLCCAVLCVTRAMLAAVLGRPGAGDDAAAGQRRRGLGAAARNAAVVAEAYPESEAHAGMGADGESACVLLSTGVCAVL
jgi:hypothetical protein